MIISPYQEIQAITKLGTVYHLGIHKNSPEEENCEISKRCDSLFLYVYDWLRNNPIV